MTVAARQLSPWGKRLNKAKTYLSKPQNAILLALGILLTITTVWPAFTILRDTVTIHRGSVDARGAAEGQLYTMYNWQDLFFPQSRTAQKLASVNLWTPLLNSVLLSALACVDEVVIFEEDTPKELLQVLRPDILVKGGDYKADEVIGRESVKRVEIISFEDGYSTTGLIEKIADLVKKGKL
jgi:hypothetical protein